MGTVLYRLKNETKKTVPIVPQRRFACTKHYYGTRLFLISVWSLDGEEKRRKMKTPEHQNTRQRSKKQKKRKH